MEECQCNPLGFLAQWISHAEGPHDPNSMDRHDSKRTNLQLFANSPERGKSDPKSSFNCGSDAFGRVELHPKVQMLGLDATFLESRFDNAAGP